MEDFTKEITTCLEVEMDNIKHLLEDVYNKGKRDGSKGKTEACAEAFHQGEVYRHKKLEEKGVSFDVGDEVRTTTDYDWEGIKVFTCGTVGTIIERHKSDIYGIMLYTVKSEDKDRCNEYLYGVADLELVESAKVPVKVGSIVKIVKEYNDFNPTFSLFSKGTLGVVTYINESCQEKSNEGNYKYEITADGKSYYYDRDGFEVVTRVEEDK